MKTRKIPLTRGLEATVDAADYHLASLHRWQAFASDRGRAFRARRQYRSPETGRKVTVTLSHVVLGLGEGAAVRHLNGDTLDCRRENLVEAPRRGRGAPDAGRLASKPKASPSQDRDPLDEEYQA